MRTFKILFKKCLRDIVKNLKQFIAIIFILAVAVTLFIGLEANSKEFDRRVDEVYSNGNISDVWVTVNPDFLAGSKEEQNEDYNKLIEISGGDYKNVERRLYLPTTVNGFSSNALISKDFPRINKGYDIKKTKDADSSNFFFVDYDLASRVKLMTNKDIKLGQELEIIIDGSYFQTIGLALKNDIPKMISKVKTMIQEDPDMDQLAKDALIAILDLDETKEALTLIIDQIFTEDNYEMKFKVNGFMRHPENIQTATFNNSCFMLSSKLIINDLVDRVVNGLPIENKEIAGLIKLYSGEFKNQVKDESNEEINLMLNSLTNQYVMKLSPGVSSDSALQKINNYYKEKGTLLAVMDLNNMPSNAVIQNDIIQSRQLTYCFPLIFFGVAILVVLTTVSQHILKERTQMGTLKSLGLSRAAILTYYIAMMCLIDFIGVALGLILGPLIIPNVMNIKYKILYSLPTMHYLFPWLSSLIVIFGTMLIVSVLTYTLIRTELRLIPAMSMRPKAPKINYKEKSKSLKNISLMMALRNIKVHFTKSLMVIFGVMGCTGLLICGFGIDNVIDYGKNGDLNKALNADLQINYNSGAKSGFVASDLLELRTPNNERLCTRVEELSILQTNVEFNSKNVNTYLYYLPADTEHFGFTSWDPDEGICINESRAEDLGVKAGDYVDFSLAGKKYHKKIVEVVYTFSVSGLFVYQETIPELTNLRTNAWVTVNDSVSHDQAKEIIANAGIDGINSILTHDETIHRVDGYVISIRSMTNTVKVFAIILAVIVLINLSILNFTERLRDIATLKVLGYSKWEIARSLIYETMILTFIGALLGMALGMPLEIIVLMTNETPLVAWKYIVYPISYVISIALSIITAALVNVIMSTRINKISMSESLKSVE